MKKRWVALILLIVLLLGGWFSRAALVRGAVNWYLAPDDIELNCLQWSLDSSLNIDVAHLCLQHSQGRLEAYHLRWNRGANLVAIEQAILTITPSSTSSTNQNSHSRIDLTLPANLPQLQVQNLRVESSLLRQPVQLMITQIAPNQWQLDADWHALLTLQKGSLTAQLNWHLQDVARLSAQFPSDQFDATLLQAPIATEVSFDGQFFRSQSQLALQQQVQLDNCNINVAGQGAIGFNADWLNRSAEMDLRQFELRGDMPTCAALQQVTEPVRFTTFIAAFPEVLSITEQALQSETVMIDAQTELGTSNKAASLALKLSDLEWRFDGTLSSQYQVNGKVDNLELGQGQLQSSGHWQFSSQGLQLNSQDNHVQLTQLNWAGGSVPNLDVDFEVELQPDGAISASGRVNVPELLQQQSVLQDMNALFTLSGSTSQQLQVTLNSKIASLTQSSLNMTGLESQLDIGIKGLTLFDVSGQSHITDIDYANHMLGAIQIKHQLQINRDEQNVTSQHDLKLNSGWYATLTIHNQQAELKIVDQPLPALADISQQWLPEMTIQSGQLNANIMANLSTWQANGSVEMHQVSLEYQDSVISQASYQSQFEFDSAGLQLSPSTLHIKNVDAGVLISDIQGQLRGTNSQFSISDLRGSIFDGQFVVDQLWLDGREQTALLNLTKIDTAKILALQKQSGIEVTGLIKGHLPLHLQQGRFSIVNGKLSNQGAGKLVISDNQAFTALKAQQPEIQKQLSLLENLDIDNLTSSVNLSADGWLKMDIAMQGTNPLQQEQVNFNYGHEENILVLLKALRLTDSLTEKIEQSINQ